MNTESLEKVKQIIERRITEEKFIIREHDDAVWGAKNRVIGLEYTLGEIDKEIEKNKDQGDALHTPGHAQTTKS
ncbi:hypothetical protein LCGC14_2091820 [marine sediment metagenome]|uniref:Uncharacterized protein n=1 Tax=marine sediment metagenome TaxID=412755 RepID=A0A0F9EZZ2_9ZZZZ